MDDLGQTNIEEAIVSEEGRDTYSFFLDRIAVAEGTFDVLDENLHFAYTRDIKDDEETINILAFTSRESYIQWGVETDNPVEKMFQLEDYVESYALEHSLYETYENTGEVPERHLRNLNEYYFELFPEASSNRIFTTIRTGACTATGGGTGNTWVINGITLLMPPGFNNDVESFEHVAIGGFLTVYDRNFLRRSLGTFWNWGLTQTCFTGPLAPFANRMSSGVGFSL